MFLLAKHRRILAVMLVISHYFNRFLLHFGSSVFLVNERFASHNVFCRIVPLRQTKSVSWFCAPDAVSRYCFPASCLKINLWHNNIIRH
jgi:hypothetical protein